MALGLLATVGLGPLASNGPLTPVDSPLEWVLAAVGTRRQFGQPVAKATPSGSVTSTGTSQTLDGPVTAGDQGDRQGVAEASTMGLAAPMSLAAADTTPPTVSLTSPPSGAVSGAVTLSAAAADNIGVAGVQFLVNGALFADDTTAPYTLTAATTAAHNGTYTLTAVARDAAGNTTTSAPVTVTVDNTPPTVSLTSPPSGTVSGTVTLSAAAADNVGVAGVQFLVNGALFADDTTAPYTLTATTTAAHNGTYTLTAVARDAAGNTTTSAPVTVTVDNTAPIVSVIGDVTLTGFRSTLPPVVSADGTRAVVTTFVPTAPGTTRVAVINTVTGTQTGTTVTLVGSLLGSPLLSADGTRVVVATTATPATTQLAVINLATGTQTGTTVTLAGSQSVSLLLSADGTRALITSASTDATGTTTRAAVVNTTNGTQTGTTVTVTGSLSDPPLLSADGSRALVTTYVQDATGFTTRVAVINTATGTQSGTTLTLSGYGSRWLSADGTRALITTSIDDAITGISTTRAVVINTTTGTQTGTTLTLTGHQASTLLSADGTHALIITDVSDQTTGTYTTRVAAINTTTGTQTGATVTLTGSESGVRLLSADGSRALIATTAGNSTTGFSTWVTEINATTGTQTSTVLAVFLTGDTSGGSVFSDDGTRALVTTYFRDANNIDKTRVAVIDTTTGAHIGATLTLAGSQYPYGSPVSFSADGSRALITTAVYDGRTSTNTIRVAVINTSTGIQVGTTTTLTGFLDGGPLLSPDRSRAVVITNGIDWATGTTTTQVAVINTSTGTQIGTTVNLAGNPSGSVLSADGTHALIIAGSTVMVMETASGLQVSFTGTGGLYPLLSADGSRALVTISSNPTRVVALQIV
jgi:hypothetical protein